MQGHFHRRVVRLAACKRVGGRVREGAWQTGDNEHEPRVEMNKTHSYVLIKSHILKLFKQIHNITFAIRRSKFGTKFLQALTTCEGRICTPCVRRPPPPPRSRYRTARERGACHCERAGSGLRTRPWSAVACPTVLAGCTPSPPTSRARATPGPTPAASCGSCEQPRRWSSRKMRGHRSAAA